jgi:hypothetical protein
MSQIGDAPLLLSTIAAGTQQAAAMPSMNAVDAFHAQARAWLKNRWLRFILLVEVVG